MKLDQKNEIFIGKEELFYFFRRFRFKALVIFIGAFVISVIGIGGRPHFYSAKAQFHLAGQKKDLPAHLDILNSAYTDTSSIGGLSLLTSNELLTEVVEKTGLQITAVPRNKLFFGIASFFRHLKTEMGGVSDYDEGFVFSDVKTIRKRDPFRIELRFLGIGNFEIYDAKRGKVGEGRIGEAVQLENLSFTLSKIPSGMRDGAKWTFDVLPLDGVVEQVKKKLSIKVDKQDSSAFHAVFSWVHPEGAKRVLSTLFAKYEFFKRRLRLDILSRDIEEIQNQEKLLRSEFFARLENRAKEYSNQIGEGQFIDAGAEIEILHSSKKACLEKLLELEILLGRLEEKNSGLSDKPIDLDQNIQTLGKEIEEVLRIHNKITSDPKTWDELYSFANRSLGYATPSKSIGQEETSKAFASQIIGHLKSKKELFESTSQALSREARGKIDLALGQGLLTDHYRKIFETESLVQQLTFLKGELLRPDFEISSLSSLLSDPFMQSLLKNTSELSLQLHDLVNHTTREQDRIRDSIAFTKQFLDHHLRQKIDLLALELKLMRLRAEKIQNGMLEQIRSEKNLLEKRVRLVQQEVAELPNKWLLENYFEVESELSKNILKSLVSLEQNKILEKLTFHSNFQILDPIFALGYPRRYYSFAVAAMVGGLFAMIYLSLSIAILARKGFPISSGFLKACDLKEIDNSALQQALWLSAKYANEPISIALFSRLTRGEELVQALNQMGFKAICKTAGPGDVGDKSFSEKVEELRQHFDFILLMGHDLHTEVEKSALLKYSDLSLVTCRDQSTSLINPIIDWAQKKGVQHVAFAIESEKVHR